MPWSILLLAQLAIPSGPVQWPTPAAGHSGGLARVPIKGAPATDSLLIPRVWRAGIRPQPVSRSAPVPAWQEQKTGGGWILVGALVGAFVGALIAVADASDCSECMIPNVSWVFIGAIVGAVIVIRVL